ncbi:hypothetical protein IV203_030116 [Nitzschia inconspicua]|uniref:Uncharacterized protein n=1 Tax=Nitzschia inconspicua TaxID=303405 RepID=A0A9K3LS05_9STRA|nr:hypothetical protein IV203_030116 [Nitzschia inconspicua]
MKMKLFGSPQRLIYDSRMLFEDTKWEGLIVVAAVLQSLLRSQMKIIIQKHQQWSYERCYKLQKQEESMWRQKGEDAHSWDSKSPLEWANIYGSILLVVNVRYISTGMSKEKLMLEDLQQKSHVAIVSRPHFFAHDETNRMYGSSPNGRKFIGHSPRKVLQNHIQVEQTNHPFAHPIAV